MEHSRTAIAEIIVLYKYWVIFKQYISKRHKWFGIKIYKLCNSGIHIDMKGYFGKDKKCETGTVTATHATIAGLTTRTGNVGYKLYMDFSYYPDLFNNVHTRPQIAAVLSD
jgi:hypothetical protein